MKNYIIASGIISLMLACNIGSNNTEQLVDNQERGTVHEGEILLKKNCYVCHHPTRETGRIAPPMQYVKEHYIKEGTTEEEFTEAFISFIKNPTKESAKMPGAVANFGLMPQQAFSEETLKKIADYIYNNEIEGPDDFEEHKKNHGKGKGKHKEVEGKAEKTKAEQGLEYALTTKAVLGKNLMGKIQSEGTIGALEFCNIQAIPLTDSMSKIHHALISRVTDKPRNQDNLANESELSTLSFFKQRAREGEEPESVISEKDGKTVFYFPILTNAMCMQCHGKAEIDIENSTLAAIKTKYPEDKATGYGVNEVRGMWKVVFD
jgi:cytochrome c553